MGPRNFDKECSCYITMKYRCDPMLPPISSYNSRRDEVTIFQINNNGNSWIVYKGFLAIGGKFVV